ncbi:hypothetical protein JTB14_006529 [Gonioctena quinquepunctata]|nr:hypothetical protein JTB14_006529 [Gonioctena quinquepunctata]
MGARKKGKTCIAKKQSKDAWVSIIAWFKEDADIRLWLDSGDEDVAIKTIDKDTLDKWRSLLLYQGFDIKRVVRIAYKNYEAFTDANKDKEEVFTYPTVVNGANKVITYSNQESFSSDLHFIITVFALRGCRWDKITVKSVEGACKILEMLKEKLVLKTDPNTQGETLGLDDRSVARLTACFPLTICDIYDQGYGKPMVSMEQLSLPNSISKAVQCPFLSSCLPREWIDKDKNVNLTFFLVHLCVDDLIHRTDKQITLLADMFQYYRASYDSTAAPAAARRTYCTKLGLKKAREDRFCEILENSAATSEAEIVSK